jgi:hypothetical protein
MAIATGKKPRSAEVDRFAQSFSGACEKQEVAADEATEAVGDLRPWSGSALTRNVYVKIIYARTA